MPSSVVTDLPRIRIEYQDLPTSGLSLWDDRKWVICLNASEPASRQRFTLLHEYKHIIDHGRTSALYTGTARNSPEQQAEQAADYFAGCALMPKRLIKRAWGSGLQRPTVLARHFDVSPRAIEVRLTQLGLIGLHQHCAPLSTTQSWRSRPGAYYRQCSSNRLPTPLPQGVAP